MDYGVINKMSEEITNIPNNFENISEGYKNAILKGLEELELGQVVRVNPDNIFNKKDIKAEQEFPEHA
jgi:hypothetical protein